MGRDQTQRTEILNSGVIFAALGTFLLSTNYLAINYLEQKMGPEFLVLLWFVSATVASAIMFILIKKENPLKAYSAYWKQGLIIGFTNAISAVLWVLSIKYIGPALSSFYQRLSTVFIIILAFIILKERLTRLEMAGAAIAILGAGIISYNSGDALKIGVIIAVLAALTSGLQEFLGKFFVKDIDPVKLVTIRTGYSMAFLLAFVLATGHVEPILPETIPLIVVGSTLSAVLGFLFLFMAYQKMEISKASIIRTLDPFLVLIFAFLLFRTFPSPIEIVGGILIVAGVIISEMNLGKAIRQLLKRLPF